MCALPLSITHAPLGRCYKCLYSVEAHQDTSPGTEVALIASRDCADTGGFWFTLSCWCESRQSLVKRPLLLRSGLPVKADINHFLYQVTVFTCSTQQGRSDVFSPDVAACWSGRGLYVTVSSMPTCSLRILQKGTGCFHTRSQ